MLLIKWPSDFSLIRKENLGRRIRLNRRIIKTDKNVWKFKIWLEQNKFILKVWILDSFLKANSREWSWKENIVFNKEHEEVSWIV
jgi:hypothetical protein